MVPKKVQQIYTVSVTNKYDNRSLHDAALNDDNGQEDDNIPDFILEHIQN